MTTLTLNFATVRRQRHTSRVLGRYATLIGPILALVVLFVLFSALAPSSFLTGANMSNIASQVAVLAVMATGLTFVLILGEIDLSVAFIGTFAGVAMAAFYSGKSFGLFFLGQGVFQRNQLVAVLVPLAIAGLLGWVSSLMINRIGIPSFIATLAIYEVASGWALYWSSGNTLYTVPASIKTLGSGTVGAVPTIAICALGVLFIADLVLRRTQFGRTVFMIGSNREAARLSGVPVRRVVRTVFVAAAVLSALAGLLDVGRLGSVQADTGSDLLLPAIAAVVLGGTSLFGGIGGIPNTIIGLLIYGVLNNGLDQLDVNIFLKPYISGLFLIGALLLNMIALRASRAARNEQADVLEQEQSTTRVAEPASV